MLGVYGNYALIRIKRPTFATVRDAGPDTRTKCRTAFGAIAS